jgi:hypothetical protein
MFMSNEQSGITPVVPFEALGIEDRALLVVNSANIPEYDAIESGLEKEARELFLAKRHQESANMLLEAANQFEEHGYLLKASECLQQASDRYWYIHKLELEEMVLIDAIGLGLMARGLTDVAAAQDRPKPIRAQYPNLNRLWWEREEHPEEGTPLILMSGILYEQYISLIRTQAWLGKENQAKSTYRQAIDAVPPFRYSDYEDTAPVLSGHELTRDTEKFRDMVRFFIKI